MKDFSNFLAHTFFSTPFEMCNVMCRTERVVRVLTSHTILISTTFRTGQGERKISHKANESENRKKEKTRSLF